MVNQKLRVCCHGVSYYKTGAFVGQVGVRLGRGDRGSPGLHSNCSPRRLSKAGAATATTSGGIASSARHDPGPEWPAAGDESTGRVGCGGSSPNPRSRGCVGYFFEDSQSGRRRTARPDEVCRGIKEWVPVGEAQDLARRSATPARSEAGLDRVPDGERALLSQQITSGPCTGRSGFRREG